MNCRITNKPLTELHNFGTLYASDFVKEINTDLPKYELKVGANLDEKIVQLYDSFDPDSMYQKYWYNSSINESMRRDLRNVVDCAMRCINLNPGDAVLDIASNSGELLTNYPTFVERVGVDPCDIARNSPLYEDHKMTLVNDYFTKDVVDRKFKIVTCCAMFYDLENPVEFCKDVSAVMDDNGIFILQLNHLNTTLDQIEVGNFSQEHVFYYNLDSLWDVLSKGGFYVFDAEMNFVNGGSMRVYCHKKSSLNPSPDFMHPTQEFRAYSSLQYELRGWDLEKRFKWFLLELNQIKIALHSVINQYKNNGWNVYGYGASTKGNTVLQLFDLTTNHIQGIAERYEPKIGLLTAGSWIPIIPEEELRSNPKSLVLVFP